MERYTYQETLSAGAYGIVYKCLDSETGRIVAAKAIRAAHTDTEVMRLTLREVKVLRTLPPHPNVVTLLDAFRSKSGRVYLVFEYVERSLYQEMSRQPKGALPGPMLKSVAWQLLHALGHCHDHGIVHRDVKPANVLLTGYVPGVGSGGVAKLCDFGFARPVQQLANGMQNGKKCSGIMYDDEGGAHGRQDEAQRLSSYVMTRWYRPPEVLVGDMYGINIDVWSLGCTLAELATGRPLFPGTSTIDQLWRILRCLGPLPQGRMNTTMMMRGGQLATLANSPPPRSRSLRQRLPELGPQLFELISACLTMDPRRRPTVHDLLQMPYFWDVPRLLAGTDLAKQLPYSDDVVCPINPRVARSMRRRTAATGDGDSVAPRVVKVSCKAAGELRRTPPASGGGTAEGAPAGPLQVCCSGDTTQRGATQGESTVTAQEAAAGATPAPARATSKVSHAVQAKKEKTQVLTRNADTAGADLNTSGKPLAQQEATQRQQRKQQQQQEEDDQGQVQRQAPGNRLTGVRTSDTHAQPSAASPPTNAGDCYPREVNRGAEGVDRYTCSDGNNEHDAASATVTTAEDQTCTPGLCSLPLRSKTSAETALMKQTAKSSADGVCHFGEAGSSSPSPESSTSTATESPVPSFHQATATPPCAAATVATTVATAACGPAAPDPQNGCTTFGRRGPETRVNASSTSITANDATCPLAKDTERSFSHHAILTASYPSAHPPGPPLPAPLPLPHVTTTAPVTAVLPATATATGGVQKTATSTVSAAPMVSATPTVSAASQTDVSSRIPVTAAVAMAAVCSPEIAPTAPPTSLPATCPAAVTTTTTTPTRPTAQAAAVAAAASLPPYAATKGSTEARQHNAILCVNDSVCEQQSVCRRPSDRSRTCVAPLSVMEAAAAAQQAAAAAAAGQAAVAAASTTDVGVRGLLGQPGRGGASRAAAEPRNVLQQCCTEPGGDMGDLLTWGCTTGWPSGAWYGRGEDGLSDANTNVGGDGGGEGGDGRVGTTSLALYMSSLPPTGAGGSAPDVAAAVMTAAGAAAAMRTAAPSAGVYVVSMTSQQPIRAAGEGYADGCGKGSPSGGRYARGMTAPLPAVFEGGLTASPLTPPRRVKRVSRPAAANARSAVMRPLRTLAERWRRRFHDSGSVGNSERNDAGGAAASVAQEGCASGEQQMVTSTCSGLPYVMSPAGAPVISPGGDAGGRLLPHLAPYVFQNTHDTTTFSFTAAPASVIVGGVGDASGTQQLPTGEYGTRPESMIYSEGSVDTTPANAAVPVGRAEGQGQESRPATPSLSPNKHPVRLSAVTARFFEAGVGSNQINSNVSDRIGGGAAAPYDGNKPYSNTSRMFSRHAVLTATDSVTHAVATEGRAVSGAGGGNRVAQAQPNNGHVSQEAPHHLQVAQQQGLTSPTHNPTNRLLSSVVMASAGGAGPGPAAQRDMKRNKTFFSLNGTSESYHQAITPSAITSHRAVPDVADSACPEVYPPPIRRPPGRSKTMYAVSYSVQKGAEASAAVVHNASQTPHNAVNHLTSKTGRLQGSNTYGYLYGTSQGTQQHGRRFGGFFGGQPRVVSINPAVHFKGAQVELKQGEVVSERVRDNAYGSTALTHSGVSFLMSPGHPSASSVSSRQRSSKQVMQQPTLSGAAAPPSSHIRSRLGTSTHSLHVATTLNSSSSTAGVTAVQTGRDVVSANDVDVKVGLPAPTPTEDSRQTPPSHTIRRPSTVTFDRSSICDGDTSASNNLPYMSATAVAAASPNDTVPVLCSAVPRLSSTSMAAVPRLPSSLSAVTTQHAQPTHGTPINMFEETVAAGEPTTSRNSLPYSFLSGGRMPSAREAWMVLSDGHDGSDRDGEGEEMAENPGGYDEGPMSPVFRGGCCGGVSFNGLKARLGRRAEKPVVYS